MTGSLAKSRKTARSAQWRRVQVFSRYRRRIYNEGFAGLGEGRRYASFITTDFYWHFCCLRTIPAERIGSMGRENRPSARNIVPWRRKDGGSPGLNETANYVLPIPLKTTPQPTIKIRKRDRDRAERIRLAGGPKPTLRERAVRLALEKGEVRTKDLTDIGVPRCYLARICEEGLLVKVGYGRYRAAVPKAA